ncbi:MAG: cysteine desulfurase family protein [Planctomycetota bacterium]
MAADMDSDSIIYLDNNATTPPDPDVIQTVTRAMQESYANASNTAHAPGQAARVAVETAREQVASLIGARIKDVVFTSGATESCNLAIKGLAATARQPGHIVTAINEHKAVTEPVKRLQLAGWEVTWLRPDRYGMIHAEQVAQAIRADTLLVSIMAANNVVGTINPIGEIGSLCRQRGVLLHCDATQAVGKVAVDVEAEQVDLLSLSAHKFHDPKGVGALYVRRRSPKARLIPLLDGGGHERGLRSGTLNVPGIAGLGEACRIAAERLDADAERITGLRDRLQRSIEDGLGPLNVHLNGHPTDRLPNTLNVALEGVEANELLRTVGGVAFSAGSACTSGTSDPFYVLRSMGMDEQRAACSVRLSLGRFTTAKQVDRAAEQIVSAARSLTAVRAVASGSCCCDGDDACEC